MQRMVEFADRNGLEKTYEKGVRVARKLFQTVSKRLLRDETLPKYFVRISPKCDSG